MNLRQEVPLRCYSNEHVEFAQETSELSIIYHAIPAVKALVECRSDPIEPVETKESGLPLDILIDGQSDSGSM